MKATRFYFCTSSDEFHQKISREGVVVLLTKVKILTPFFGKRTKTADDCYFLVSWTLERYSEKLKIDERQLILLVRPNLPGR